MMILVQCICVWAIGQTLQKSLVSILSIIIWNSWLQSFGNCMRVEWPKLIDLASEDSSGYLFSYMWLFGRQ